MQHSTTKQSQMWQPTNFTSNIEVFHWFFSKLRGFSSSWRCFTYVTILLVYYFKRYGSFWETHSTTSIEEREILLESCHKYKTIRRVILRLSGNRIMGKIVRRQMSDAAKRRVIFITDRYNLALSNLSSLHSVSESPTSSFALKK